MARQTFNVQLRLPEQDLQFLTIGSDNPKQLQTWIEQLPMGNLGESARQLYQIIGELNRLNTVTPKDRFQLVELLRPSIQHVCSNLGKHYLNQPVVLPEKAKKIATLAQALQTHLATTYKIIAVAGSAKIKDKEIQKIVAISTHRAITNMTQTLLRCYQLYYPTPRFLWLEIHQLFLLAEFHKLVEAEVEDSSFKYIDSSNIRDAYIRALLLAASRPNQLRQNEILAIFHSIESWTDQVSLNSSDNSNDIFVFNLDSDLPPTYRNIAKQSEGDNHRYIDASKLVDSLQQAEKERGTDETPCLFIPPNLSSTIVLHLAQAWGSLTERSFARIPAKGKITIGIGLGATHYFLSGGVEFEAQLSGEKKHILSFNDSNPFGSSGTVYSSDKPEGTDVWSNAFDGGGHTMANDISVAVTDTSTVEESLLKSKPESGSSKYDNFSCDLVNSSPGGYCLQWAGDVPSHLRTGEIICIQESGHTNWRIGVVRWVKQLAKKGAQLGIELLAPSAVPCATKVVKKGGETTEFMRTLLLPELKAIGQPATLLTPNIAFNVGYKVIINLQGEELRTMLIKQVSSTSSFTQFKFKAPQTGSFLDNIGTSDEPTKEDFDSIWSSL